MKSKQKSWDLLEIVKDILSDSADPKIFSEAYHIDGTSIKDFPPKAQEFVYEAREKFFRSGEDEFHLDVDLKNDHKFESKKSITPEVINQIRPLFAAEYLKHIGMANSAVAIKHAQKLLPLTPDNFEIHTRKKGYNSDQMIIYQNPKIPAKQSKTRNEMAQKCQTIRRNFLKIWDQIDHQFPTEIRKPLPRPFIPESRIGSAKILRKDATAKIHCPSTIPNEKLKNRKKPQTNPFVAQFNLNLPRSEIEATVMAFIDRFDFLNYLKSGIRSARDCAEFLRSGICPRALYHVAKYMHSIFVLNLEDLPDFVRARALWHVIYKNIQSSILECKFISVALMMIKVCTFVLFQEHADEKCFSNIDIVQSTLFYAIDNLLNSFRAFDSLERDEYYQAKMTPVVLEKGKRIQTDIIELLNSEVLLPEEEKIARLMVNPQGMHDLLCFLGAEPWGDTAEFTGSKAKHRYNETRMVQKLIEMDIAKLNEKMPRKPPDWVRPRKSYSSKRTPAIKSLSQVSLIRKPNTNLESSINNITDDNINNTNDNSNFNHNENNISHSTFINNIDAQNNNDYE